MNASVFGCPNCQQLFQVRRIESGELLLCPHCGQQVRVPLDFDSTQTNQGQVQGQVQEQVALYPVRPTPSKSASSKPIRGKNAGPSAAGGGGSSLEKTDLNSQIEKQRKLKTEDKSVPKESHRSGSSSDKPRTSADAAGIDNVPIQPASSPPSVLPKPEGEPVAARDSKSGAEDPADLEKESNIGENAEQVADWLPPRFEVADPSRWRDRDKTAHQVILPGSDGQLQTVDQRIVTIEYKGEKYRVLALAPAARKRRQLIINLLSILLALLAIWFTFRILTW
jgi:DNA-directed RNA polymerase subunit M/transcription elongation factor TFIIS